MFQIVKACLVGKTNSGNNIMQQFWRFRRVCITNILRGILKCWEVVSEFMAIGNQKNKTERYNCFVLLYPDRVNVPTTIYYANK